MESRELQLDKYYFFHFLDFIVEKKTELMKMDTKNLSNSMIEKRKKREKEKNKSESLLY